MDAELCVDPFRVPTQQPQDPPLTGEDGCVIRYRVGAFKSYQDSFSNSLYGAQNEMLDLKLLVYDNLGELVWNIGCVVTIIIDLCSVICIKVTVNLVLIIGYVARW